MARPRKAKRILPPLDPTMIESGLLASIQSVADLPISGDEKKQRAIAAFGKWLDDKLKLPWYLEPFDGPAITAILSLLSWLIGGWMESVYLRWKASQPVGVGLTTDKLVEIATDAAIMASEQASKPKAKKARE